MPFLRGLMRKSICVPDAIASSSWTTPSHYSLLTGKPPWEVRFNPADASYEVPNSENLADAFRQGGGVSAAFSANQYVSPNSGIIQRFDRYCFASQISWALRSAHASVHELAGHLGDFEANERQYKGLLSDLGTLTKPAQFAAYGLHRIDRWNRRTAVLARQAKSFVKAQDHSTPKLLFFNLMEVHEPYVAGPFPESGASMSGCFPTGHLATYSSYLQTVNPQGAGFREAYLDSARELDFQISNLFRSLSRTGVLEDAVVVIASDHGQGLGEHGFFGHGHFLHDELVRIPVMAMKYKSGRLQSEASQVRGNHDLGAIHGVLDSVAKGNDLETAVAKLRSDPVPVAMTYFEGRKSTGSERVWALRVIGGSCEAIRSGSGAVEWRRHSPMDGSEEDRISKALELFESGRAKNPPSPSAEVSNSDQRVASRLETWGYV